MSRGSEVVATYPPEALDFDSTDIPDAVKEAFTEAIACHSSQCFVASGMMVRKTLEEICRDRGAEGNNLFERIEKLGDQVILPPVLLEALHEIRLLGNDAAHVESKDYDDVSKEEVEAAIAVTRQILLSIYQLDDLVSRLTRFKSTEEPKEN